MEENQNVNNYDENDKKFVDVSNQYVKNAFCYIPLIAFFLYFAEKERSSEYERHMKYGMFLFVVFILVWIVLGIILALFDNYTLNLIILGFLFMFYFILSAFLGYRAYNKQDVKLKFLDDLLDKIFGLLNKKKENKTQDTTTSDTQENKSENVEVEDPFAELDKQ